MTFPVFDLHCDTAMALLGENYDRIDSLRSNNLHIDLERAKSLPGYAQCFACFTTPFMEKRSGVSVCTIFERELAVLQSEIQKNPDLIRQAFVHSSYVNESHHGHDNERLEFNQPR